MTTAASSYGAFSVGLHRRLANQRMPLEVSLEVTRRCPLECKHCYNNLAMGDLGARNRELSKEEYFGILDELAEMGVLWLLFTGGEIFARKDFLEIYRHAKEKGFLITLFTNGTMINEKIVDQLREYPPFGIEITLYGRTKEIYELMTGIPGSHDRCLRGIHLLLDRGLPLKLKTVATSINKHEVGAMRQFAEDELGVEFKFDSLLNPRIDCSQAPLSIRLSPEEVVALDLQWPKVAREHRQALDRELASLPIATDGLYACGGGVKGFAIDPYGMMSICVLSQREAYDIRGGIRQGWETFLGEVRSRKRTRPSKCSSCRIRTVCATCPANGELENGDPESPVEFLCEVAHLRATVLGFDIPAHGECASCTESGRARLKQQSARILAGGVDLSMISVSAVLPVLNNLTTASTSCGGCAVAS